MGLKSPIPIIKINNNELDLDKLDPYVLQHYLRECAQAFPTDKKYELILLDPPWSYQVKYKNLQGQTRYPTL